MRTLAILSCALALAVAGCGGGGGGGGGGGSSGGTSSPGTAASAATTSVHSTPTASNVVTMRVDAGPGGHSVDIPYVSVTVCVPGSVARCQTFNDIEVDTGSYGLRILAGARDTSGNTLDLPLPQETEGGEPLLECTQFVDGYSWGPVETADVHIGSEAAGAVPVQVIGTAAYGAAPGACASTGTQEDTVAAFGANGLLGVGPFAQDCGTRCATDAGNGLYYVCPASGCLQSTAALDRQVRNPVVDFQTDDNGVIIELPALSAAGASAIGGSLVFGIGTEGNNVMSASTVLVADPSSGSISTTFQGKALADSYFDTGSNAYFFPDAAIPICPGGSVAPGFFCPASPLAFTVTNAGLDGTVSNVTVAVDGAVALLTANPDHTAFDDIAVPGMGQGSFDFGLPFFFGRDVYVAIAGENTSAGMGPYFAY